jgi:hypothetical protein
MSWFPRRSLATVALAVVFGYVIYEVAGQPMQAKLFPMVVGVIGLTLVLITLVRELREGILAARADAASREATGEDNSAGAGDFSITEIEKTREGKLRALEQFGWLAGLLAGLWLLGFYIAVPLLVALYLLRSRERLMLVAPMTAGTAVIVWLFNELLNLPFPAGQLLVWLNL